MAMEDEKKIKEELQVRTLECKAIFVSFKMCPIVIINKCAVSLDCVI